MRRLFPVKSLGFLMLIGVLDLLVTAALNAQGLIEERNPLMAGFLEQGEWSFAFAKGFTLILAWLLLVRHAKKDRDAVRQACRFGSVAYLSLLGLAFFWP